MPRYEKGQLVKIRDVISNRQTGHTGRVTEVTRDPRGAQTSDKYTISFPNGESQEFWNIQLELVADPGTEDFE